MKKKIIPLFAVLLLCLFIVPVFADTLNFSQTSPEGKVTFNAIGDFAGMLTTTPQGDYFDTSFLYTSSGTEFTKFTLNAYQDLAGYTSNKVYTNAYIEGDGPLLANLGFDMSMYVVYLERAHDLTNSPIMFSASGGDYKMGYTFGIKDSGNNVLTEGDVKLTGDTAGALGSGYWFPTAVGTYGFNGWGNPDGWKAPQDPNNYTPYNYVVAAGDGTFYQHAMSPNNLYFNGGYSAGGNVHMDWDFTGDLSMVYSMSGN